MNDRSKESRFLWNYNKFDQPTFFAWDEGDGKNPEPNNFNGQCNIENCVEMNSVNKKWNDVVCKAHRSYMCERKFAEGEVSRLKYTLSQSGWDARIERVGWSPGRDKVPLEQDT